MMMIMISNNSVLHKYSLIVKNISFKAIQLSQTVLFQTIQFSIQKQFHFIQFTFT